MRVPLFVKLPGQHVGQVSDRNVETIDVLPTVLDVIGAEQLPPFDGCSAVDPSCSVRAARSSSPQEWRRIRPICQIARADSRGSTNAFAAVPARSSHWAHTGTWSGAAFGISRIRVSRRLRFAASGRSRETGDATRTFESEGG